MFKYIKVTLHRLPADESSSCETTKAVELILWVQLWSQHQQEAINKQKTEKTSAWAEASGQTTVYSYRSCL